MLQSWEQALSDLQVRWDKLQFQLEELQARPLPGKTPLTLSLIHISEPTRQAS